MPKPKRKHLVFNGVEKRNVRDVVLGKTLHISGRIKQHGTI